MSRWLRRTAIVGLLWLSMTQAASAAAVQVQWTYWQGAAPYTMAVGFWIYRQDGCVGAWKRDIAEPIALTMPAFQDHTLRDGQRYCWTVTAVDDRGIESDSQLSFQAPDAPRPAPPLRIQVVPLP